MISARLHTTCPGCSAPIEPGDMIGPIGLAFYCSDCFEVWELENKMAPRPTFTEYPISGTYEPEI